VNPRLLAGQMHGGIVHGLGNALMEEALYDEVSGQLLTGTLMDYALPRADDVPSFGIETIATPSPNNMLGFKGVGELPTNGAPAALANAVLYMAVAPKSNAAYVAYNAARAFVAKDKSRGVPEHLRNAPTKLMKELGYGADYRYAHDEAEGYAAGEKYLPEGMPAVHWYQPVPRGLEQKIAEKLAHLRELDAKAAKTR